MPRSSVSRTVGSLTWSRGSNRPTPMRTSSRAGGTSRSPRARSPCGPTARAPRRGPPGWTSSPRESSASGGCTLSCSPSTRRQPSASTISGARTSPRSVWIDVAGAPVDLGGLELRAGAALLPQQLAEASGSRRSRTSTADRPARGACRACGRAASRTSAGPNPRARGPAAIRWGRRTRRSWRSRRPRSGRAAGPARRLPPQLAGHGEARKARPAHDHVVVAGLAGVRSPPVLVRRLACHLAGYQWVWQAKYRSL